MELSTLTNPDCVLVGLETASKKQALKELACVAAQSTGLENSDILDVILEREKLGSTAVGGGIAIPHGKVAGLENMTLIIARLSTPIDFDAVDDTPVDLVFMLLAPEEAGADHLKALSRLSRTLRDEHVTKALRHAEDCGGVIEALTSTPQSNAA